jgi:glycosyltransferase involved in cell wall biosynthesis
MQRKNLLISVIIPALNEEILIGDCLNSLSHQSLNKKFFEVIVVDNNSDDKTAKIAKKYNVKVIREKIKSVVAARQKGVNASKGKIIVSGDADTVYPPNWLKNIKNDFDKNPKLIALVGWIYYSNANPFFDMLIGFGQETNLFFWKYTKKFSNVYAANFAFKKEFLKKVGGYPSHLVELGDQQYLLYKFFDLGEVIIDRKVQCFTSNRKTKNALKNIFLYNFWHRLLGYNVNRIMGKRVIGPTPTVRNE